MEEVGGDTKKQSCVTSRSVTCPKSVAESIWNPVLVHRRVLYLKRTEENNTVPEKLSGRLVSIILIWRVTRHMQPVHAGKNYRKG